MRRSNFTDCSERFKNGLADPTYIYNGTVRGIFAHTSKPAFITVEGCRQFCGTGIDYYPWRDSSTTITTWVLPVIGLLLQAPYESNEFRRTVWALARWVGNPMASLAYTLWNIKVTGKCALMVDMATEYGDLPDQHSQYAQFRDSFFILSVMNQYSLKPRMPAVQAERLLRVALFSDSLKLSVVDDTACSLTERRRKLADLIRKGRKKSVVPVFISLMWFLFSLAISIQAAFNDIGANATAHDMALGALLSWLPVLILTSIVDRNPVAAQSILVELNTLLDDVRAALLNPDLRDTYMRDTRRTRDDFAWTDALNNEDYFRQDFFTKFAGQGRIRWHYGVAHPILAGIETAFKAKPGRNWLRDAEGARTAMVLGPKSIAGLRRFDFRMIWQIISSVFIVGGTAGGAFILSYFTPTVGLGCRSGGYLIYVVIALGTFAAELAVWWITTDGIAPWRRLAANALEDPIVSLSSNREPSLSRIDSDRSMLGLKIRAHKLLYWWTNLTVRDRIEVFVLRPWEVTNSVWLVYIVFAQTFGSYRNCDCQASTWGSDGGYIDFESYDFYRAHGVGVYWGFGIGISCLVMTIGFAFVVAEYCTQSHLSTEDYKKAARGLRRTRWFKKHTSLFRDIPDYLIRVGIRVLSKLPGPTGRSREAQLGVDLDDQASGYTDSCS